MWVVYDAYQEPTNEDGKSSFSQQHEDNEDQACSDEHSQVEANEIHIMQFFGKNVKDKVMLVLLKEHEK